MGIPSFRLKLNLKLPAIPSRLKLPLLIALGLVVLYYILVGTAANFIYRKHVSNGLTRSMERVFPYPAALIDRQIIPLSRFRREVTARENYAAKHQQPASTADLEKYVMEQLTNRVLYEKALTEQGITISDKDVDSKLQEIYKEIGGEAQLAKFLQENYGSNITLDDFRLWTRELLAEAAIKHQLLVHVDVRHILVSLPENASAAQADAARAKAADIKSKITDLASFEAAAKDRSEDVASRDKGGTLGTTIRGEAGDAFSPEFEQALFTIPVKQVSDPVRSKYGWHLLWIDAREGKVDKSMADFTTDLRRTHRVRPLAAKLP